MVGAMEETQMRKSVLVVAVFASVATGGLAGCGDDDGATADTTMESIVGMNSVVDVFRGVGYDTFSSLVDAAGMAEEFAGTGPFTVFVPTDEAFAELDPAVLVALQDPANVEVLRSILRFHAVEGNWYSNVFVDGEQTTLEGSLVELSTVGGVTVSGVNVVTLDIPASNGVVHAIDAVLVPPTVDLSLFTL
jgi:uncharacterized surface protein with fasciclin (FAS1) repeats